MKYLLLGATRKPYTSWDDLEKPETINPLLLGSAEEVIAAACAYPGGVLLVDLTSVPTARFLAQSSPAGERGGKT